MDEKALMDFVMDVTLGYNPDMVRARLKAAIEKHFTPERESVAVEDVDVEIAIAEAIHLIPKGTTYEDTGTPVLEYLKKCGFRITYKGGEP